MGITNLRLGLEQRLSHLRGELETAREEVRSIEEGVARLSPLHDQISGLEEAIRAFETAIRYDNPEWRADKVKPVKARVWNSPFKSGEIGRNDMRVPYPRSREEWFISHETTITLPDGRTLAVDGIPYEGWGTAPGCYSFIPDLKIDEHGRMEFSKMVSWKIMVGRNHHPRQGDARLSMSEANSGIHL